MMTKIKYSATLANGHIVTRNSERTYSHYWLVSARAGANDFSGGDSGFARSRDLAVKAQASAISRYRKFGGPQVQIHSEIVPVVAQAI